MPPLDRAAKHLPEFSDRVFRVKLLYIALNPCLGRVLDKNICFQKDVAMQFGLARTIAANGVYMNARTYHIVRQNGLIALV